MKDNLKEFAFKSRQRLACDSFFGEIVPFSYCPGKERKSKNILVSFPPGTINLKGLVHDNAHV